MPQQKIASNELEFSSGAFSITGAISVSAGSNTAPGFTTAGDTNTGMFFPAADTIAFSEGGVESMRIDSSGNMGIGTSSPSQKLHVVGKGIFNNGTSSNDSLSVGTTSSSSGTNFGAVDINGLQYSGLYLRTENVNRFSIFQTGIGTAINTLTTIPLTFGTNDTERMRIDSSGNVGIGTTSPDNKLEVVVGDNGGINIEQSGSLQTGYLNFRDSDGTLSGRFSYDHGNDSMRFNTNTLERMRINSAGEIGIGTTTMTRQLNLTGSNPGLGINLQNTGTSGRSYSIFTTNSSASVVGALGFYDDTAGAYRIIIDSAGRVTMPAQPFFYARKTDSQTAGNGTTVNFGTAVTNIGSHYNTSTNRFTAPITGVYSFTAKLWINRNGQPWTSFEPRINGTLITGSAGAYYDSSINNTGNANYIVNFQYSLNAGDFVEFTIGSPGNVLIDNSGYFCGFLLS